MSEIIAIGSLDGQVKIRSVSSYDKKLLTALSKNTDVAEVCAETNCPPEKIAELMSDPDFVKYVELARKRQAKASELNPERLKAIIATAVDKAEDDIAVEGKLSKDQLAVINLACEVVGMKRQKIDLTVEKPENPYSNLSEEELDKMLLERAEFSRQKLLETNPSSSPLSQDASSQIPQSLPSSLPPGQ